MQLNRPAVTFRILALLCIAAAAALLPAPAAHAQGTSGMLPDPISTGELDRYAQFLGLSSEQRQAIEPMHSRYLQQFAQLRSDEIDDFLEETRGLRRNLFSNSDGGESVRKATRNHNRIMSRISSLDDQLFNQIQTVLSEEQVVDLSRARLSRERQRYSTNATRFATAANPSVRVDLTDIIFDDIDLNAADMQAVDVPLRRYESQLTDALKSLYGVATGMFERITDYVNETVGEVDREDPQQMQAMFRAMREAWEQANADVSKEAKKVSTLNRQAFESMCPLLSDDGRRALQRRFYRQAYATAFRDAGTADRRFDAALDLDDLSDETRTAINQLRGSFESRFGALASQLMDAVDQRRAERSGMGFRFGGGNDDNDPSRDKLNNLRDRLSALEDETLQQLHALLGDERVAAIEGTQVSGQVQKAQSQVTIVTADGGPGVATFTGTVELETSGSASDPYVAGPISQTDLDFYVQTLDVDEQVQAIIDSIYAEYRDSYQRISEEYLEPLAKVTRESWGFRPGRGGRDDVDPPTTDDVNRIYTMRREAMNEVMSIDDTFFTDIGLLFDDSDTSQARMRRIRQSRLRDVYNRGDTGPGGAFIGAGGGGGRFRAGVGGEEEHVDLTRALRDIEFGNDHQPAVEAVLNNYSDAMTAALRQQYETSLAFAEAMQRAIVEMISAERAAQDGDDGDRNQRRFRMGGRMREIGDDLGEQRRNVTQQIVQLNRQTVDELRNVLPAALASDVRDAYYAQAFPGVYRDRNAAGRPLDSALELPDLTGDQRSSLLDVAAEYRGAYDELNLEMVRVQMTQPTEDEGDDNRDRRGRDWQRMQEVRNEIERLRFARDELNEKTRRRIRAVLNDRQIGQVRGLEPSEG